MRGIGFYIKKQVILPNDIKMSQPLEGNISKLITEMKRFLLNEPL